MKVFEFNNYKDYLRSLTGGHGSRRGIKIKLAKALRCQPTYISQVLNQKAHFSLEQGELVCSFLGMSDPETHHFLLLLQKDRAGSHRLRRFFLRQIEELAEKQLMATHRLSLKSQLSNDAQATYYSSWQYAAIHIGIGVLRTGTRDELARYFNISESKVASIVDFLIKTSLVKEDNGRLVTGRSQISLESASPHIAKHHTNWRQRAVTSIEDSQSENLHYSAVVAISRQDFLKIKEQILQLLQEQRSLIKKSQEEDIFVYNIDFFKLGRDVNSNAEESNTGSTESQ